MLDAWLNRDGAVSFVKEFSKLQKIKKFKLGFGLSTFGRQGTNYLCENIYKFEGMKEITIEFYVSVEEFK